MNKARIVAFFLAGALLSACATPEQQQAARSARWDLIGFSRAELFACAGAPAHFTHAGGIDYLSYVAHLDGSGFVVANPGADSLDWLPFELEAGYCEVSFELREGAVHNVRYTGAAGEHLAKPDHCGVLIQSCLPE